MDNTIEAATETLPTEYVVQLGQGAAIVVFSLATYGAQDLTRKGVSKVKQFRANRKAKKAAEKVETDTPQTEE